MSPIETWTFILTILALTGLLRWGLYLTWGIVAALLTVYIIAILMIVVRR